jgi:coenzyme PQQ precursor peptide PqqA
MGVAASQRRIAMKWETPQATELRFGMEITMYVANR